MSRAGTRQHMLVPFQRPGHRHEHCVTEALERAERECAHRGQRLTPLRRRVLELVWSRHEPVKAYELLEILRAEHKGAAPPTVYRALEFLLAEGFVHRIESMNAFVGCGEPTRAHHGQFWICERCGAVAEMDDNELSALIARKARQLGFETDQQTIEIHGICRDCSAGSGQQSATPAGEGA